MVVALTGAGGRRAEAETTPTHPKPPERWIAPLIPPHNVRDGTGRNTDIIAAIFKTCGWPAPMPTILPYGRHWVEFERGGFDAASVVPDSAATPGARSGIYIYFRNGAGLRADAGLKIATVSDLKGLRVITFTDGQKTLPGLQAAVPAMASFVEQGNQEIHSRLLLAKRVDAVLADGLIFAEYNSRVREEARLNPTGLLNPAQAVTFAPIFEPTGFRMIFRDPETRDAFNACLAITRASGALRFINQSYINRYRGELGDGYTIPD